MNRRSLAVLTRAVALRPRGLVAALFVAALLVAVPEWQSRWVEGAPPVTGPVPGVGGRWLYVTFNADARSVFKAFEAATGRVTDLHVFPPGVYAGGPAASPDGRQVAYSLFRTGAPGTTDPGGADLWLMNADASRQRMVVRHDAAGVSLGQPAWTPDGRLLYFVRWALDGGVRIDRAQVGGPLRQTVVADATEPAVSARGRLVYVRTDRTTYAPSLWIAVLDGRGAKALVEHQMFLALAAPRFSPDGGRIAFAAAHDTTRDPTRTPTPRSRVPRRSVASAHGLPMDIWVVNVDGTGLRQLTELGEDDPVPAWSHDGKWIAFASASGLYLLDPGRQQVLRLYDDIGGGGFTWLRR
jgi:Tol biopolymer transport system component